MIALVFEVEARGGLAELASSAQHHQGDGPTSPLGRLSMSKGQSAVCSGGLVVVIEAVVWLKLVDDSPSRVCVSENRGDKDHGDGPA